VDPRAELIEHLRFFGELGVTGVSGDPRWRGRGAQAAAGVTAGESLEGIRADLGDCTRCKLHAAGRRHIVFGVGNPHAELMFIGEAPGADEDAQGIPFVGRAGQLLTRIIESIKLTRDQVYIANIIKCRPPGNRNPEPDEVATCEPFLARQIESIRPKVIVALGALAAHSLLGIQTPISHLRGRIYTYGTARVVPTFHPAFLLRSPDRKRDVWEDMKKVRAMLAGDFHEPET
jgi:DNA polymerase